MNVLTKSSITGYTGLKNKRKSIMKTKLLVTEWFGEFPVLIVDVELLAKIVDGLKPLVIFAKKLHPRRSFHDNQIVYG